MARHLQDRPAFIYHIFQILTVICSCLLDVFCHIGEDNRRAYLCSIAQFNPVLVHPSSSVRSGHLYVDRCANRIAWVVCWFVPERGHEFELAKKQLMIEKRRRKTNMYIQSPPWESVATRDKKSIFKICEGKAWCHHVVYFITLWYGLHPIRWLV